MSNIVRTKAAVIRWSLLISLAVECETQCAISDFPSDAEKVVMSNCDFTSINTTALERFTNLQDFQLSRNDLTTFPDLSPIAGTLVKLGVYNNKLTSINTTLLKGFTNLKQLYLYNNKLSTFPDLSPIAGTLMNLDLYVNKLTSINTTLLEGFTNLQHLRLVGNVLTTFPDLSPIAGTLKTLVMAATGLTSINSTVLEGFTNLEELRLDNNKLTTIPDFPPMARLRILNLGKNKFASINTALLEGLTNLRFLLLSGNALTTFPDLSSIPIHWSLKIDLSEDSISVMTTDALLSLPLLILSLNDNVNLKNFPHTANGLRYTKQLNIRNTGISILPPILFDNIANMELLDIRNSVEICNCENSWLKQEGPKIANFQYDYAVCGDQLWSSMTVDDFRKKCEGEKHLKINNVVTLAEGLKTKMSLAAALLHSHVANLWLTECTARCLEIAGCVSFYYQDRLGDCATITPGNTISMASVLDGGEEIWTYFAVP